MRDNLELALARLYRYSEAEYKNHFRHVYRAYAIASSDNLDDLRRRLATGAFQPTHATKVYLPKRSGALRPYSLLSIEDQVVYQAMVNLVAERFDEAHKAKYYRSMFSNIPAGAKSQWFYRDWRRSYRKFTRAIVDAYGAGYRYVARFDLTACYDSICHKVLSHFLQKIGLDKDFCSVLCDYLVQWTTTSSANPIYHGHGIPQGPMSSGLLAETVLVHFDDSVAGTPAARYVRYVDDIRLFGRSSEDLREPLMLLDLCSKQVGLFPQTAKTSIQRVKDIEDEIKTLSESGGTPPVALSGDQDRIHRRLRELTRGLHVSDDTRFKYTLVRRLPRPTQANAFSR